MLSSLRISSWFPAASLCSTWIRGGNATQACRRTVESTNTHSKNIFVFIVASPSDPHWTKKGAAHSITSQELDAVESRDKIHPRLRIQYAKQTDHSAKKIRPGGW